MKMMNNTAKKDPSGLWLLSVGAFFFINPTYHLVDILPDCIAYFLFFIGLSKLAALNDETAAAKKNFVYLFVLSVAKLCFLLSLPHVTNIFLLLCTFVFAVAEAILFIPAVCRMFRGFEFLEMRMNCAAADGIKLKKKTVTAEKIRNMTIAAFLMRTVISIIPTLPSLAVSENTVTDAFEDETLAFAFLLISVLAAVVYLAVALPWYLRFMRYTKGITDDTACCKKIAGEYCRWSTENEIRIVSGRMSTVMILLIIAAALMLNMYVDGVNIFPTGIGALLILSAFVILREQGKAVAVAGSISCALWAAASAIGEYLQLAYKAENYRPASAVHMVGKAPVMYLRIEICGYVEATLAAVSMLLMLLIFTRTLDRHAKKYAFYTSKEKKRFDRCLIPVIILWMLAVLMSAAIMPILKFFAEIWLINGLIVICLVIFMIRAYTVLYDGIYMKLYD